MKKIQTACAICALALAMTGRGSNTANNLGGAADDGNDVYGSNMYWDGYGINNGYDLYRSSYGTPMEQTEPLGEGLKEDVQSLGNDVKNAVEHNPVSDAVRDAVDGSSAKMMN